MVIATESDFTWGGSDYTFLSFKDGTTVPTGLSTSAYTSQLQQGSVTDGTFTKTFIVPTVFDAVTIIDGTIEGTLKLGVYIPEFAHTGDSITITKAELTIRAIDTAGTPRTLEAIQEIWSGSISQTGGSGTNTEQMMYWVEVSDMIIDASERMVFDFTITYTVVDTLDDDDFYARIYCTLDTDETTITLPFVM
jgi:hypothetical protein